MHSVAINTLRGLALDLPRQADSGHSGTALACAPLGWLLYSEVLRHSPEHPAWPDRDRFVMSNGHACVLLYGLLHLCGYDLSLDDLKAFRKPGSRTPGHPESWVTPGIDASTGPLGLGIAMAVGMALAERYQRHRLGSDSCDHWTYLLCSDGDLMEGVSHEACSFAGHQRLGRLILFYDDNQVTIDGPMSQACSDQVELRFQSYGWQILTADGEDLNSLRAAIESARSDERPSFIRMRTVIGHPAPNMKGRPEAHSPPFSHEEVRATKALLGLDPDETYFIHPEIEPFTRACRQRGQQWVAQWSQRASKQVPLTALPELEWTQPVATRTASGRVLAALSDPRIVGGSADLAGSTCALLPGSGSMSQGDPTGRNIHFGVRELAMAGICIGMAQHGGLLPFCSTYFSFSDFMKPALRLAALARLHTIFVWSHDSLALGEDGPTHQPVEQLATLRALPNFLTFRPADARETEQAWRIALRRGPAGIVLSRQTLPLLPTSGRGLERGGYVVRESRGPCRVSFISTGSEVHLCLRVAELLEEVGFATRVVSLPCWELFLEQTPAYREEILGEGMRVAVEAAASLGWHQWVGHEGLVLCLDEFGASGPGEELMARFGFDVEHIYQRVLNRLREVPRRRRALDCAAQRAIDG